MTRYDRSRFGQAWLDADRNGCDTRNDVLRRDLQAVTLKAGTNGCLVLAGALDDPYTGRTIQYVRGDTYSVDIDHVVSLGNAWVSGAWRWDVTERAALANDPMNLLAVDAGANRSKGDSDAASWLPPVKGYRCDFVARQVAVKAKYHLTVTTTERWQVEHQLQACPGRRVVEDVTHAPTRTDQHVSEPSQSPPGQSPPGLPSGGGSSYFANCDAARAAGAAPVHRGDPGYGPHLDRDGDGTACE